MHRESRKVKLGQKIHLKQVLWAKQTKGNTKEDWLKQTEKQKKIHQQRYTAPRFFFFFCEVYPREREHTQHVHRHTDIHTHTHKEGSSSVGVDRGRRGNMSWTRISWTWSPEWGCSRGWPVWKVFAFLSLFLSISYFILFFCLTRLALL